MKKVLSFQGDPFAVAKKFHGRKGLFFLDSSQTGEEGRFSYVGFAPFKTMDGRDFDALRRQWQRHRAPGGKGPFTGGAVGYIGYGGDYHFGFYDQVLVFDHVQKTLAIHVRTAQQMRDVERTLREGVPVVPSIRLSAAAVGFKSNFSRTAYMAAVKRALRHITQGDIYQINLSRKVTVRGVRRKDVDGLALYSVLRSRSPSPFSAYYDGGAATVLSSSPERFLKLTGRTAQVKPMKGTRPRGRTAQQDARFKHELLHSPKEIAELLMVTDLERNDLGRVCAFGSVKVRHMRAIEAYKNVFQATATVEGALAKGKDGFDLLKATFPGGSVTGCPKIEAMRLIKAIEKTPRGLYTGALGYIGFNGNMDFSVLIRAIFLGRTTIDFHVGGGIVADSAPGAEYEETCVKAAAMQAAIMEVLTDG